MRQLIILVTFISIINTANAADVECEKQGRYWKPKNDTAVKIANSLGVKTCNGQRFKDVIKELGLKSNVVAGKKSMSVEDVVKSMR